MSDPLRARRIHCMSFRSKMRNLSFAASIMAPMFTLPIAQAHAGVFISVNFAPPVLPVYVQPPLPAPGYIWTPDTGHTAMRATTGFPGFGFIRRKLESFGRLDTGDSGAAFTPGIPDTGDHTCWILRGR